MYAGSQNSATSVQDRIAVLQARAAQGLSLFDPDHVCAPGEVVQSEYWTARNGYRHLVRLVRLVGGRLVEERRDPPYLDPAWVKKCSEKKKYRARYLEENRRKERERSRRVRRERARRRAA